MKKIKQFINNLHFRLLVWHQKVFDPFPDLLEEAKSLKSLLRERLLIFLVR